MKKGVKLLLISLFVVLVAGCGNKKEVVKTCTLTSNQVSQGYKLESTYEIHAKGNLVESVVSKEVVTSDNKQVIDYFKSYLEKTYKTADETYGGYKYSVDTTDNSVTSNVTIDYNKMDLNKFVEDNSSMKSYVGKNNKIKLEGVTSIYEKLGATCK